MQRNGFVKAEFFFFFFTLPEGRCSFFFPIETDILEVVSLNLSICQLIVSYLKIPRETSHGQSISVTNHLLSIFSYTTKEEFVQISSLQKTVFFIKA